MRDKRTFDDKLGQLEDNSSLYFCASATLLSLKPIILCLKKEIIDFDVIFEGMVSLIDALYDQDTSYFDLSKKEEDLTAQEWNAVIDCTEKYGEFIEKIHSIDAFLLDIGIDRYHTKLVQDRLFLAEIVRSVLEILYEREDKPRLFQQVCNDALIAMQGD